MTEGIRVSPASVRPGDTIATRFDPQSLRVIKTKKVKTAEFCPGKPEMFHLDHECYDTRFSTVVVPQQ